MDEHNKFTVFSRVLAWIVFIFFLALTAFLYRAVINDLEKKGRADLETKAASIERIIDSAFEVLSRQPLATKAFFDASDYVSAEEFHLFFTSRDIVKNNPAIFDTNFLRYIKNSQKEDLVKEISSQLHFGAPDFKIYPETKNEFVAVEVYSEPEQVNEDSFGFDELSDPVLAEAINRSIDTGNFILSNETNIWGFNKNGFVGYLPVYNKNITASSTISEKRSGVYGIVNTVFEPSKLFSSFENEIIILGLDKFDIEIFDGNKIEESRLLYDLDLSGGGNLKEEPSAVVVIPLVLGGHNFTLSVSSLGGVILPESKNLPYTVLGIGILISMFLFAIIYLLAIQYERARNLAERIAGKLTESEVRFRSLFNDSRDAIMTLAPPEWKFILGNPAAIKMFGAKNEEEFTSKTPYDYSPERQPDGRLSSDKAKEMIGIAIKNGSIFFNWTHKRLNGAEFPATVLLSKIGEDGDSYLQAVVRDISVQKKEDEGILLKSKELEASQRAILNVLGDIENEKNKTEALANDLVKFKLAVDNASDHIIITDHDGIIIYANRAVEKITGYPLKEVIGNKPSLWGKQMPKEFYEKLWKIIKEDKLAFVGEINNKRKNGEIYIAEASISPIINNKGKVIFFVGIERDITLIKEISDAKTEFVSVASHQLRTPLTGIKWLTEVMLKNREGNLSEKQKETLREINESNDRVITLVNDLLSISRIESGQSKNAILKEVEMETLINEVVNGSRPVAENRGVKLELVVSLPKNYKMHIDEEKIRQSMTNLISNAIKYSKVNDGGRVDVIVGIKDNEFIFSVMDNGIGIPLKDQRHIFDKFYRADNAVLSETKGTGLGLYIVKAYIEVHGGRIWFESEENKGTAFHFSLRSN